jgi:hypothetical protein
MKHAILVVAFFTVAHLGYARSVSTEHTGRSLNDTSSASATSIQGMLDEIMKITGLHANFELKAAKVLNIEASISHKKRLILYNPAFIDWIGRATNDKWGVIALLAHEVGHHLNGHTLKKSGSAPAVELEADEFAGFVLRKMGATLRQAQEVMIYIAKTQASATHPGREQRMDAIEKGWKRAEE